MDPGMLFTRATAVVAFVAYVIALLPGAYAARTSWSRVWWTLGCVVFIIHVISAFHFIHYWSHADAYAATARQTNELAGINFGGGVYFNYLFTVLWVIDVAWWWTSPASRQARSRAITYTLHGFMFFMWFNGTVVFGNGVARWMGVGAFVFLGLLWVRQRRKGQHVLSA